VSEADFPYDREAKAGPVRPSRDEGLEQAVAHLCRNPAAPILDHELDPAIAWSRADRDPAIPAGGLDCVLQQVYEQTPDGDLVSERRTVGHREFDLPARQSPVHLLHGLAHDAARREDDALKRSLRPREVEEVADESLELGEKLHGVLDLRTQRWLVNSRCHVLELLARRSHWLEHRVGDASRDLDEREAGFALAEIRSSRTHTAPPSGHAERTGTGQRGGHHQCGGHRAPCRPSEPRLRHGQGDSHDDAREYETSASDPLTGCAAPGDYRGPKCEKSQCESQQDLGGGGHRAGDAGSRVQGAKSREGGDCADDVGRRYRRGCNTQRRRSASEA
jgi:hypothetical protein